MELKNKRKNELETAYKRMDRLDAIVNEYLRANHKTQEELAERIGVSTTSIWRYRKRVDFFRKAPLDTIAALFRYANISNNDLRYILGLPTGQSEDIF